MNYKEYYDKEDSSGYATHIPILKKIFETIEIDNVLELGTGFFSTPFFLDKAKAVTSIETQSTEWFEKIFEAFIGSKGVFTLIYIEDVGDVIARIKEHEHYNLIFIDCASVLRSVSCVYAMQLGIETIVIHDTESTWYGYHLIDEYIEKYGYDVKEFTEQAPFTKVFTKNKKLSKSFEQ